MVVYLLQPELLDAVARTHNPFGYVGRFGVMEEADGLTFMRARYYDDATGRFLTKDLIPGDMARPQSLNRYTYTDNPINRIDPYGLDAAVMTPEGPVILPIYSSDSAVQLSSGQCYQMKQDLSTLDADLSTIDNLSKLGWLLAQNTKDVMRIINGLLGTAREHAAKCATPPPEDPNQNKWKNEVKAALDRAKRLAEKRLPGKLSEQVVDMINSIENSIP